jgi:hypothetical protein
MNCDNHIPQRDQVVFFRGQQLTANDLNDTFDALKQMRWRHNRSMHQWGIAFGLSVSGQTGDAEVSISPGFAVDCRGHEIILNESQSRRIPAEAGDASGEPISYLLTIAYPDADDFAVTQARGGICMEGGDVRLSAPALIRWVQPGTVSYRHGLDIILAQAWIQQCRLAHPLSFAMRRSARPSPLPYIASGQTDPNETDWAPVSVAGGTTIEFQTRIDTSAAHFNTTPFYQAHIMGPRWPSSGAGSDFVVSGWTRIAYANPTSFQLRVMLPQGVIVPSNVALNPSSEGIDAVTLKGLNWKVVWMGIEGG